MAITNLGNMCCHVVAGLYAIPFLSLDLDVQKLSQLLLVDTQIFPLFPLKIFQLYAHIIRLYYSLLFSMALGFFFHVCINISLQNIPVINLCKCPWIKIPKFQYLFQRTFILLLLPRSWLYPRIISRSLLFLLPPFLSIHELSLSLCYLE